jgi:hypothetical protein
MPYTAQITRSTPSCFLFMIDQSGSMQDVIDPTNVTPLSTPRVVDGRTYTHTANGRTKAIAVSDVINRFLMNLVLRCTREEGVRNFFDVGIIGYSGHGSSMKAGSVLGGALEDRDLVPISDLANNPMRIEEKNKKVEDGSGGLVNQKVKFPIWIEPYAQGGTPMSSGFNIAKEILEKWVDAHSSSFPPILINITDGEWTDNDPSGIVSQIRDLSTEDGNVLVFNIHFSADDGKPIEFPDSEDVLTNDYARNLFQISSVLPAQVVSAAKTNGYQVNEFSRGFAYNADLTQLIQFIDIGTSNTQSLR